MAIYRLVMEGNFLIGGLNVEFDISNFETFQILQSILTMIKPDQLSHLFLTK